MKYLPPIARTACGLLAAAFALASAADLRGSAPGLSREAFFPTRGERVESTLVNPALLAADRYLRLAWIGAGAEGRTFAAGQGLLAAWRGFGLSFETGAAGDAPDGSPFRRTTLGYGLALGDPGFLLGAGFSSYASADGRFGALSSLSLGLTMPVGETFLFSLVARDLVLSLTAGGALKPEYDFGLGWKPGRGLALHGGLVLGERNAFDELEWRVGASLAPVDGLSIGGFARGRGGERFLGFSCTLQFRQFAATGHAAFDRASAARGAVVLEHHSAPERSLFGQVPRYLVVDVAGEIPEDPERVALPILGGRPRQTFASLLGAVRRAAADPGIAGLYLRVLGDPLGPGRAAELVAEIARVKAAGKRVVAYLERGGTTAYQLASPAHEIWLNPTANLTLAGAGSAVTFLRGFFDKIGLEPRIFYKGKYKSAAQQYLLARMTDEHREALGAYLGRVHEARVADIAAHRAAGDLEKVRGWLERGLLLPEEARRDGLVDGTRYEREAQAALAGRGWCPVDTAAYARERPRFAPWRARPRLAVVHVTGAIVNGGGGAANPLTGERDAGADAVVAALGAAAADPGTRAIVVRVQSGGGDALAADKIWRAVVDAAQAKPLAVSMGDIAASGGYWLACGDKDRPLTVFCSRATLTGSIGVFTGKVLVAELKKKLGLATETVERGRHALLWSANVDFGPEGEKLILKSLDGFYDRFVAKVAAGRGKTVAEVDGAAQGRIWAGSDALPRGLVDRLGGVLDALDSVAARAGLALADCEVAESPQHALPLVNLGPFAGVDARLAEWLSAGGIARLFLEGHALAMLPYRVEVAP